MIMKICCTGPMEGRRERLCKTDEATVSKVFTKDGRELVERLQPFLRSTIHFELVAGKSSIFYSDSSTYHLMKALAVNIAHSFFPDNFIEIHEIRFFREGRSRFSACYSSFVPDETGVIERRGDSMERFYASSDKQDWKSIREEADRVERELNPDILPLSARAESMGLIVPHPEMNYHVYGGNTVFFELGHIDIPTAVASALAGGNPETLGMLTMLYTSYIRALVKLKLSLSHKDSYLSCFLSYQKESFAELSDTFGLILANHGHFSDPLGLLSQGYDAIKYHYGDWIAVARIAANESGDASITCPRIDPQTGRTIDRILRDEY